MWCTHFGKLQVCYDFLHKKNDCNFNTIFNTYFNTEKHDISSSKSETAQHDFNKDVPIPIDSIKINGHQNFEQNSHQP